MRLLRTLPLLGLVVACTGGGGAAPAAGEVLVVVSAPVTRSPWVGEFVVRGAELAAAELDAAGGIEAGGRRHRVKVEVRDHADSVQRAVANAEHAVRAGAAMLVTDGFGAVAVARVTDRAKLPVFVTFDGSEEIVDEDARPTVFRLAPANGPMAQRLVDYVADKRPKLAVLAEDSDYGRSGARDVERALGFNNLRPALVASVAASGDDPAAVVLRARQSGADHVVVWARAPALAAVVRAVRGAGWAVPLLAGPAAADPLVRQQLAARPAYLDGLTFVSFRITSEVGPEPFGKFRAAYEKRYGADEIGVTAGGRPVVQPPDWAMYSYDAVHLLRAALARSGGRLGQPLLDAFNQVSITGANGDERSFLPKNHEGVSPDDMYFARFSGMRFAPVEDDPLSAGLPPVPQ